MAKKTDDQIVTKKSYNGMTPTELEKTNNDKDRNRVSNDGRLLMKIMDNMMVREIMKMLTSIEKHCGVGVVPRMAPPPSQGGSTLRRGMRERLREK